MGRSDLIYRLGLYDRLAPLVEQEDNACGGAQERYHCHGGRQENAGKIEEEQQQPVQLFCVSLRCRQGYGSAFRWLAQFLE